LAYWFEALAEFQALAPEPRPGRTERDIERYLRNGRRVPVLANGVVPESVG
jgi:hypothetical protein